MRRTSAAMLMVCLVSCERGSAPESHRAASESSRPVESAPLDSAHLEAIWAGSAASPSPDGRFLYTRDDRAELVRVAVDEKQITQLTADGLESDRYAGGGGVLGPVAVSADGKRLAFTWSIRSEYIGVRVLSADGSREFARCDTRSINNGYSFPLAWTEDGEGVLMGFGEGPATAVLMDLAVPSCEVRRRVAWSTPVSPSAEGTRGVEQLDVSPDRTRVVYTGGDDLWAIELDSGAQPHLLLSEFGNTEMPTWSPDGQWVLFTSNVHGARDLFALPVEGVRATGDPRRLRSDIGWTAHGRFSRSGDFFFLSQDFWERVYTVELDSASLQVAGTPQQIPDPGAWRTARPSWSPDGERMAFISELHEPWLYPRLVVREHLTARSEILAEGRNPVSDWPQILKWTPDSRHIFMRGADGEFLLFGVTPGDVREARAECIPDSVAYEVTGWMDTETVLLHWSPSREAITVRACNLATGVGRDLLHLPGGRANFALSPNRGDLVFWLAPNGRFRWEQPTVFDLRAADPMSSSKRLQFFDEVERPSEFYTGPRTHAWSHDGKEILVATWRMEDWAGHAYVEPDGYDRTTASRLWALPIDGGEVRPLGEIVTPSGMMGLGIEWLTLHPFHPTLLFAAGSKHNETRVIRDLAAFLDRIDVR